MNSGAEGSEKKRKAAYFYAHRGDGEMFEMAVAGNLTYLRKKELNAAGRDLLRVISRDREAFESLMAARRAQRRDFATRYHQAMKMADEAKATQERTEAWRKQFEAMPDGPPKEARISQLAEVVEAAAKKLAFANDALARFGERGKAARMTLPIDPAAMPLRGLAPTSTKLYVLGHGEAGGDELSSAPLDGEFLLKDVAQSLMANGLSPDFEDFRMGSCESADAETRNAFGDDSALHDRASSVSRAPAQIFVDELRLAGFSRPRVTGYEGSGVKYPSGPNQERLLGTLEEPMARARRSAVARVFTRRNVAMPLSS
ncbi:hypothetical protein B0G57_12963 [Trinickia symbiotica]|uniref:Peptidase C80 domain-containing protein n=1 Tax=Trinickia symbiotica TaxID=863227 RepID=A0A2N7WNA3_9BURK|nr:hypothetical protein [Trinickia symbiotica]PMS30815.1 hypothetical protein C0Z20_29580 [Trinickia symbiotica]PPK41520.1 hypothetical protein B0G57_12963 [Trinickia symbiotica]